MSHYEDLNWGQSWEKRPIPLYSDAPLTLKGQASPVLFIGGVHGDEPEGVELAKKTLEWLKSDAYLKHQHSKKPSWILIPALNVDGVFRRQRTNAQGIDLNRNFPSKNWKPSTQKDRYYSGAHPMESPEVKQLVALIENCRPDVIIHSHSWKPCIVCTGPKDHPYAQLLSEASGYELVHDIGYPTPGSLGDYGWHDLKTPVLCIEEQENEDLRHVWPHFQSGIQKIFLGQTR